MRTKSVFGRFQHIQQDIGFIWRAIGENSLSLGIGHFGRACELPVETFVKIAEALQVSADHLLRPDVPEVKTIYQGELAEVLEGCSASEMEAILNIVREVKASMHKIQNTD